VDAACETREDDHAGMGRVAGLRARLVAVQDVLAEC
jgi:hypothetical protein